MKPSILHKIFILLSWILPLAIVYWFLSATFFICTHSYSSCIHTLLDMLYRPDLETKLKTVYVTSEKYALLKVMLLASSTLSLLMLAVLFFYRKSYARFVNGLQYSCSFYVSRAKSIANSFSKKGKIVLHLVVLILLIRSIYYAITFYIQYDEAWNYDYFLDKNIFFAIGAYNNYPLHNIVSWFFIKLFGNSVFVLRLPSILIGLMSVYVISLTIKYFVQNEWIAIATASIFACMPVTVFYMMYARGVIFELFFAIAICSLIFYFVQTGFTRRRIFLLAILNAFGTYSMLSHPYFIVASAMALIAFACFYKQELIVYIIAYTGLSFVLSFILLLPMLLGTGLSPGLSVITGAQSTSAFQCLKHVQQYAYFITGFHYLFYVLACISFALLIYFYKKNQLLFFTCLLNLSFLLLTIAIPCSTKTFPPERALAFLVIVPVITCALVFAWFQSQPYKWLTVPLVVLCVALFSYKAHTHHFLNWSKTLDAQVYQVYNLFKKEHIHSAYNACRDFDYFIPGIEFYSKQDKEPFLFASSSPQSTRYLPSIDSRIQCIIYSKHEQKIIPAQFVKLYEVGDVIIYKRRS